MPDTGILYGETSTFKTTNMGFAAEHFYEVTGGATGRLICSDAQGPTILQPYIDAGMLEPYNFLSAEEPEYTMRKLVEGYWPDASGRLVPSAPGTFGRGKVGWYLVDTIGGIGDCLMDKLRQDGRQIGQDVVGKWSIGTGDQTEKFCNNPPSHYGWVQREVLSWMRNMSGLPVAAILYGAHEAKGESEDNKLPIRGPSLVGTAATPRIPKDLGYCIHMEAYTRDVTDEATKITTKETKVRGFFVNHPDQAFPQITYKCNPRVPVGGMARLMERFPGGFFVPTLEHGLDEFLRERYAILKEMAGSKAALKAAIDQKVSESKKGSA